MKRADYQRSQQEFYNVMCSDNLAVWRQLGMWAGPQEYRIDANNGLGLVQVIGHDEDFVWQIKDRYQLQQSSCLYLLFGDGVMVRFIPQPMTYFSTDISDFREQYINVLANGSNR